MSNKGVIMIARTVFLILTCFATFSLCAAENMLTTGAINLTNADSPSKAKNVPLKLNNKVDGKINLYHSEHRGVDAIRGEFVLENKQPKKMFLKYRVVFNDKKGLVAQSKGTIHLSGGKTEKVRIGNIVMSRHGAREISSYEIHVVESGK